MNSTLTIGKKLGISFGALLLATLGLALTSLRSIHSLDSELKTMGAGTGVKLELAGKTKGDANIMRAYQRGVVLGALSGGTAYAGDRQKFEATMSELKHLVEQQRLLQSTPTERQLVATMADNLPKWSALFQKMTGLCAAGKAREAAEVVATEIVPIVNQTEKAATDLMDRQVVHLHDGIAAGAAVSAQAQWAAWILVGVVVVVALAGMQVLRRSNGQLKQITSELADGAGQIASASAQVASSSQSLAQGASEQAASLEETSASSEEITAMTRKNSESSGSAAGVMATVDQHVRTGNAALEQMVGSMQLINGSSEKISKIIKVIDEIAFQTNILALNAAVEAARAGEAGMGFAVVADEVRTLAQRSAQAAKDTASLIEESISSSSDGKAKLDQVAAAICAITDSSGKVKTLVDEVNLGSQEQARGIEQISKAIAQMDQVTQATAASAEESASASEELSAQAEALQNIVVRLRGLVGAGK